MPRQKKQKDKKTSSHEQGSSQSSRSFAPSTFPVKSEEKSEQTDTNIQQQEITDLESVEQTLSETHISIQDRKNVIQKKPEKYKEENKAGSKTEPLNIFRQKLKNYNGISKEFIRNFDLSLQIKQNRIFQEKYKEYINNINIFQNVCNNKKKQVEKIEEIDKEFKKELENKEQLKRAILMYKQKLDESKDKEKRKKIEILIKNNTTFLNENAIRLISLANNKKEIILNKSFSESFKNIDSFTKALEEDTKVLKKSISNQKFISTTNYQNFTDELNKINIVLNNTSKMLLNLDGLSEKLLIIAQLKKEISSIPELQKTITNYQVQKRELVDYKRELIQKRKTIEESIKSINNIVSQINERNKLREELENITENASDNFTKYVEHDNRIIKLSKKYKSLISSLSLYEQTSDLKSEGKKLSEKSQHLNEEFKNKFESSLAYLETEQQFQLANKTKKGKTVSSNETKRNIPKVKYDRDGKFRNDGERHEMNDIGIYHYLKYYHNVDVKLVRVQFDSKMGTETYEKLLESPYFEIDGTYYRFDMFGSKDRNTTFAIETDQASLSTNFHPFEEAIAYTRQAFLTESLAAYKKSKIHGATVGDKTPFELENTDKVKLMVGDGWGFIKESLAKKLMNKIESDKRTTAASLTKDASPNTQMLQWLPKDNKLIIELIESGIKQFSQTSNLTNRSSAKDVVSSQNDMSKEDTYRTITTGKFPVKQGTAMPVGIEEVVFPPGIFPEGEVALHRNPADTLNWTTGNVASETPMSKFIGDMDALQYRWAGKQMGVKEDSFVMFKGMLGVIPDKNWPSKYKRQKVDMVVCAEDRKVDKDWNETADIEKAKQTETKFVLDGDLVVTQYLKHGSLIGVPPEMMKKLSGDYDGDQVHALARSDSPMLFRQIKSEENNKVPNPKLKKVRKFSEQATASTASQNTRIDANPFAMLEQSDKTSENPDKISENPEAISHSVRIFEMGIGQSLVGIWSTIADLLSTVKPVRVDGTLWSEINDEIFDGNFLQNSEQLRQYIGLGIKAGTDLAKTSLEGTTFLDRELNPKQLLEEGRKLINFLIKEKNLRAPHKKRNAEWIAKNVRNGKRLGVVYNEKRGGLNVRKGHYGNLFEIMLAMDLHLESKRTGDNFTYRGQPGSKLLKQGIDKIEKARRREIRDSDAFVEELYEILGELKQILSTKNDEYARENGSIWMLRAIREFHPAELRQNLYTESPPPSTADLQSKYDILLTQTQQLWLAFIQNKQETKSVTPSVQQPSSATSAPLEQNQPKLTAKRREEGVASEPYEEVLIRGDGNCLFRAIAAGLKQFGERNYDHRILRRRAVDYIRNNRDIFGEGQFVSPEELRDLRNSHNEQIRQQFQGVHTYEDYLRTMERDGIWGGEIETNVLQLALDRQIIIHYQDVNFVPGAINLVHIGGNHFNLLIPQSRRTGESS